jgi:thiamine-monophosphate kinase
MKLIQRHLLPVPRVEWGKKIASSRCASAMIDISDGLSSDLAHLCEASGVGAAIYRDRIPYSLSLRGAVDMLSMPPWDYASSGGEDYELLFAVPPSRVKALKSLRMPVTDIGMVTTSRKMVLVDAAGKESPLIPGGYDHFRGSRIGITASGKRSRRKSP